MQARVVDRLRNRQPHQSRRTRVSSRQRLGDQRLAFAGQLIDQADGVDLDQIGEGDDDGRGHERDVHADGKGAHAAAAATGSRQNECVQGDDRHHQDEGERKQPFIAGTCGSGTAGCRSGRCAAVVEARDRRHRVAACPEDQDQTETPPRPAVPNRLSQSGLLSRMLSWQGRSLKEEGERAGAAVRRRSGFPYSLAQSGTV